MAAAVSQPLLGGDQPRAAIPDSCSHAAFMSASEKRQTAAESSAESSKVALGDFMVGTAISACRSGELYALPPAEVARCGGQLQRR